MRRLSILGVLMLAGCAGAGSVDCGPVDHQRYLEGYRDGFDQRPSPMM